MGYTIALAGSGDVRVLPQIERAAQVMFQVYPGDLGIPEELYDLTTPVETFEAAQRLGRLWVATASGGAPVGFALVDELAGYAHLDELDVLPDHGRRGIGTALLAAVCSWARARGYPAVSLRTFRDVPWNAPFYRSRGFTVVESAALSQQHVVREAMEQQRGLRTDIRVTMAYYTANDV